MSIKVKEVFEHVCDVYSNYKIGGLCLLSSIVMHEILEKEKIVSSIKVGFIHLKKQKLCNIHIWLEVDGNIYDAASNVLLIVTKNKDFSTSNLSYENKILSGFKRIDIDTPAEKIQSIELIKAYKKYRDEKTFDWDNMPDRLSIATYKCYNKFHFENIPTRIISKHNYEWNDDPTTRDIIANVVEECVKIGIANRSPMAAMLCNEILSRNKKISKVLQVFLKIGDRQITSYVLNTPGGMYDIDESILSIVTQRNFRNVELVDGRFEDTRDYLFYQTIRNYNECKDKSDSIYWKNAPIMFLDLRKKLLKQN